MILNTDVIVRLHGVSTVPATSSCIWTKTRLQNWLPKGSIIVRNSLGRMGMETEVRSPPNAPVKSASSPQRASIQMAKVT